MQVINDEHWNHDHHLIHYSLDYTGDPTPSLLGSTYVPLNITSISGFVATINGNEITVTSPSNDHRLEYGPVTAMAIRLHTYPLAGDHVGNNSDGNFILNEVSFASATAIPEPSTLATFSLLGVACICVAGWRRRRKR